MKQSQEILIIGGGVIGVCAAYYLSEQGHSVTLLEKDSIASGSSNGNAGLIVPSHAVPLAGPGVPLTGIKWMLQPDSPLYIKPRVNAELMRWLWHFLRVCNHKAMQQATSILLGLNQASMRLYKTLHENHSLDCAFQQKGIVYLFTTKDGFQHGIEEAELIKEQGANVQILEGLDAVQELEPHVLPSVMGGIYYPDDGHLIPDRFVEELARLVESRGVNIHTQTEVLHFEKSGQRLSNIITTRGDYQADWVVMASGAWSPLLSHDLQINLPIQPAKGYSITVKSPPTAPSRPLMLAERKIAVTPMADTLRFAGTLELAGHNHSINQRRVDAIRRGAREYLPANADSDLIEIWRGMRPLTPDTVPIIGVSQRWNNLIIATGHGMLGQSMGPVTGQMVAQLVDGKTTEKSLSIERF